MLSKRKMLKKIIFRCPNFLRGRILRSQIRVEDLDPKEFDFDLARTAEDVLTALKLVHEVYSQEGYTNDDHKGNSYRVLQNHLTDKALVFQGKKGSKTVFSVSIFIDSTFGLPMDTIFKEELNKLRCENRRLVEVGCLATLPTVRNRSQLIPMHGNKLVFSYARDKLGMDDLVVTVHPKHQAIYEDILQFKQLGKEKPYGLVNGNPAIAMRLDLNTVENVFRKIYKGKPRSKDLHDFFFERESGALVIVLIVLSVPMSLKNVAIHLRHHYSKKLWFQTRHKEC